jgi:3-isopropylmalate/(R)-2-methylmalate dehydratase small subunit
VSIEDQTITLDATGEKESFYINDYKKTCLLNGYDDIDYLINNREAIIAFEQKQKQQAIETASLKLTENQAN